MTNTLHNRIDALKDDLLTDHNVRLYAILLEVENAIKEMKSDD